MSRDQITEIDNIEFESFIGPWVLPNEEIPVHIVWDQDFDFERIIIDFPEALEFVEAINLINYDEKKSKIEMLKSGIKKLGGIDAFPNFFGLVFVYRKVNFEGLKIFKDIYINFIKENKTIKKIILTAKIFRPLLKDISDIPVITLSDDKKYYALDINLECEGFGFVAIRLEPEINETKVPYDHSIFTRVYENLESRYNYIFNNNEDINLENVYNGIEIENVDLFLNFLKDCCINPNLRNEDIISSFKEMNFENIFIADFITELLKETRLRYKYENILLDNPIMEIPDDKFNEIIHNSKIYVHYKDLMKNKYEPIEIHHNIKDRRSDVKGTRIKFIINIKQIKDNSFEDIEKVGRD